MICPYNRKSETLILQWRQSNPPPDEGRDTDCEQIQKTTFTMMECPQEGCAAWYNGRCHYAAISLANE